MKSYKIRSAEGLIGAALYRKSVKILKRFYPINIYINNYKRKKHLSIDFSESTVTSDRTTSYIKEIEKPFNLINSKAIDFNYPKYIKNKEFPVEIIILRQTSVKEI